MKHFWNRLSLEYAVELQQRVKWRENHGSLQLGALVLVNEANVPPYRWCLGRTIHLHPGPDNVARVASIHTNKGIINGDLLLLACTFLFTFPSASKFLREQNIVKLPHPFYLKTFNLHNVNGEINESLKYNLTQKANTTENHEKKVCLLLDEIYVKPKIIYTGNNVIGVASNGDTFQAASTLQVFMIRIICGCSVTCKKYDFKIFV
jgi:hypothetical protein